MNQAHPIRVMLVDDQDLFREGVALIVGADPGIEVVGQAPDGRMALEVADELAPDVVLMDIRMPEMNGVDATRHLLSSARQAARQSPLRVIVLTTFALDDQAALAIKHGASGFLLKDATPAMLRQAIRTVHAGNAVLGPDELASLLGASFAGDRPVPREFSELTERELDVFSHVVKGLSNAEIAARVFASESTVKTHVGAILRKLGLRDRVQMVVFAYEHGVAAAPRDERGTN
jgi:DNA-binding NarL/FixJ family response regulator